MQGDIPLQEHAAVSRQSDTMQGDAPLKDHAWASVKAATTSFSFEEVDQPGSAGSATGIAAGSAQGTALPASCSTTNISCLPVDEERLQKHAAMADKLAGSEAFGQVEVAADTDGH